MTPIQNTRKSCLILDPNIQASILFAQNGVPYTFQNGVAFFHGGQEPATYPATVPTQPQVCLVHQKCIILQMLSRVGDGARVCAAL